MGKSNVGIQITFRSPTVFAGFFQGVEKTMVKTGKNRPGKNRFWTGFFHLGGKNTLADRILATEAEKTLKICDSPSPRGVKNLIPNHQ